MPSAPLVLYGCQPLRIVDPHTYLGIVLQKSGCFKAAVEKLAATVCSDLGLSCQQRDFLYSQLQSSNCRTNGTTAFASLLLQRSAGGARLTDGRSPKHLESRVPVITFHCKLLKTSNMSLLSPLLTAPLEVSTFHHMAESTFTPKEAKIMA